MRVWQKDDGFSLIEIMVVVAIMGLLMGVVVLTLPSRDTAVQDRLEKTQAAFQAVSRQSITTGRVYGLKLGDDGFAVQVLTEGGWQAETDLLKQDALRWQPLALLKLDVAGVAVSLEQELARPHIWFLPTGEYPAFDLEFSGDERNFKLTAAEAGPIEVRYEN